MADDNEGNKKQTEVSGVERDFDEVAEPLDASSEGKSGKSNPFGRLWHWALAHKRVSIPTAVIALLLVIFAVPLTRYAIAGTVLKQQFTVRVLDAETKKPVSSVAIELRGQKVMTDNSGQATIKAKVGNAKLSAEKKYYKSSKGDVLIPILKQKDSFTISIKATGRQVPVTVLNKISGKPVANIKITALGTEAKTDKNGKAVVVLPADKSAIDATFTGSGYNEFKQSIKVTTDEKVNVLTVVPAGKLYFLSNLNGNVDVVKSNLDGSSRQVVLAGTGKEDKRNTILLASRDWKYLALQSKRDGGDSPKLFLIETASDKVTTMDEGSKVSFTLVGWDEHRFVYGVSRDSLKDWQPKQQALKSINAESSQLSTLDETQAEGDQNRYTRQYFDNYYFVKGQVTYTVRWSAQYNPYTASPLIGKNNAIRTVQPNSQGKKDLETFDATRNGYINASVYEPNSVVYAVNIIDANGGVGYSFYELEDGAVKTYQTTINDFYNSPYYTYLLSPSGSHVFWNEARDGKTALFVGDQDGKNGKQLGSPDTYSTFGWFTDDYLLVSKDGSELYILPTSGVKDGQKPLKITNYYKPDISIRGYGGGYGGF